MENQPKDKPGDPELAEVYDALMRDWKEGKLTYDKALEIYTARALKKAIERKRDSE